jgi:ferredoxin
VVSSRVVGVAPERLPLIRAAASAGFGETRLEHIRVVGELLSEVTIRHFRLPPQAHLEWKLPEWARRSLKDALTTKPVINSRKCIHCGICQGHCPQGAIKSHNKQLVIHYRDCIRCFCCQEFCPEGAISVGRGWALKIVR